MENKKAAVFTGINDIDALFVEYYENRNSVLRNELVQMNIHLAEIITRKFSNRGVEYEDIYQVACVALIKAVERFNPEKGVKFSSFAVPTIIGEIKRFSR